MTISQMQANSKAYNKNKSKRTFKQRLNLSVFGAARICFPYGESRLIAKS